VTPQQRIDAALVFADRLVRDAIGLKAALLGETSPALFISSNPLLAAAEASPDNPYGSSVPLAELRDRPHYADTTASADKVAEGLKVATAPCHEPGAHGAYPQPSCDVTAHHGPRPRAERVAQMTAIKAAAGPMHDTGPPDPGQVALTRSLTDAMNLHAHEHGGNGEFGECGRSECVAVRGRVAEADGGEPQAPVTFLHPTGHLAEHRGGASGCGQCGGDHEGAGA
jgi:hypothetical protein